MNEKLVLTVEDSDADYYCIEMALANFSPDLRIRRASDGEQAIELFEGAQEPTEAWPDLVLLDRHLPRRDGFDVLTYLNARNITAKVPVVMLTSVATPLDRQRALELGARDVIIKPVKLDDLTERIRQVCEEHLADTG